MRHTLRLATDVGFGAGKSSALIHDLSESGLRVETSAKIAEGESLFVDLPFVGVREARVIWNRDRMFGCEFRAPLEEATAIANLLRLTVDRPSGIVFEEVPVGVQPTLDEVANWEENFFRPKQSAGYRLLGFRLTSDGTTVAMLTKDN